MPQAVPFIAKAVGWIKAALAATAFKIGGYAVTYGTLAKVAIAVGSYAYNRQQVKKALRSLGGSANLDSARALTVRDPAATRKLIYGQIRVGGSIAYIGSSGTGNEYLHLVICHADHECEEIGDVYLNDEVVPLDGSGNATGKYAGYVTVKKHLGTDAQTVDTDLQSAVGSGEWSNNHRLRGICYSYVRLRHNPDLFPAGLPNYSAVVKGRKVYDPRTTATAWSANPALCLRDYLLLSRDRGGFGADSAEVDDDAVETAANICDESVNLNPSGTESRYTCHGVVDTATEPGVVVQGLCGAMAGICPYVGGVFKMKAGAHTASVLTLDEDDLRGPVRFQTRDSLRNAFNGVKGTYSSAVADWQPVDFPPVVNSTYTTEDGGQRIWRDIALGFTTSSATAQRLAKIELERSRQDIVVNIRTSLAAIEAHTGDVVALTLARYGWSAKLFEVVESRFVVDEGEGGPVLAMEWTLRETASGVWDWNSGEETVVDLAPNTTLYDPTSVETPASLAALSDATTTVVQEDGTVVPRVLLSWAAPADQFVAAGGRVVVEFKLSAASDWLEWGNYEGAVTEVYLPNLAIGVNFDFRVKFMNARRVSGDWATVTAHTVAGDAAAPAAPTGLVAVTGTGKVVSLDWADSAEPDLGEYGVYRNTVNNAATATKIAEVRASRFVDADVTLGSTYYYWVTAIDRSENESAKSSGVSATPAVIGGSAVDTTAPATPSAPTYASEATYQSGDGSTYARVTVAAPALPSGAVALDLLYRRTGASDWLIGSQVTAAGNVSIDDLSPGVAYEFAARGISFSGALSAVSSTLSRTAPNATGAPATPTGLAAAAGTGKAIALSWNANTEADLAGYDIYRHTSNTFAGATKISAVHRGTRFVDANVAYGTAYYYWLKAINRTGLASAESSSATATPVKIDTGDIEDDAVVDVKIANGSINTLSTAFTEAATTSTGVIQDVTIATSGEPVFIDVSLLIYFTGASLPETVNVRIQEDSSDIIDLPLAFTDSPTMAVAFTIARTPGAGTHDYELEVGVSGGTWEFSHRSIRATEIKRSA